MSDAYSLKEVDFHTYCANCLYSKKSECESPCDECLNEPVNQYSHKPHFWEEKK